jgi:hypothetical protein
MERKASCACGLVSVMLEGDPQMHGLCHCGQCQKVSAFTYSGYWPKSAVRKISGKTTCWRKISESGRGIDVHFCPVCGTYAYWYLDLNENLIGIPIGNFSGSAFPPPVYSLWHESKLPWVDVPSTCQVFDRQPEQW